MREHTHSNDGRILNELYSKSYEHSFSKCDNIEIMTCNDTATKKPTDKDVVKLEDVRTLMDEVKKELSLKDTCGHCDDQEYGCNRSDDCPRNIAFKKWFGEEKTK